MTSLLLLTPLPPFKVEVNVMLKTHVESDDKNHITDIWQSEISIVSLKAHFDRQTEGQKKKLIGARAFDLPKKQ